MAHPARAGALDLSAQHAGTRAWASTPRSWPRRWRPARRSARRCSTSRVVAVPLRRSTSRSASISFLLGERYLPRTTHVRRPFDFLSAVMSGITFGLLIFGIDGVAHGHSPAIIAGRACRHRRSLGTLFVWRQTRLADPMMPVDIFKRPIFALVDRRRHLHLHCAGPGLRQPALPVPHRARAARATDTGILLTAWPLALAGVAPIAGRLADRSSRRRAGRDRPHQHDGGLRADGAAAARSLDRQRHVAAGAVRRGLRHLRCSQQPADDERRAAREERQRGRHPWPRRARSARQWVLRLWRWCSACSISPAEARRLSAAHAALWLGRGFRRHCARDRQFQDEDAALGGSDVALP